MKPWDTLNFLKNLLLMPSKIKTVLLELNFNFLWKADSFSSERCSKVEKCRLFPIVHSIIDVSFLILRKLKIILKLTLPYPHRRFKILSHLAHHMITLKRSNNELNSTTKFSNYGLLGARIWELLKQTRQIARWHFAL